MNNEVNFSYVYFNVFFFFLTKIIELQIGLNRRCVSGQYFIEFTVREVYFLGFSITNVSVWTVNFLFSSLESHKPCHTFDIMLIQFFFLSLSFWIIFFCLLLMILSVNKIKHLGSSKTGNLISDWYNHAGGFHEQELGEENKCNF